VTLQRRAVRPPGSIALLLLLLGLLAVSCSPAPHASAPDNSADVRIPAPTPGDDAPAASLQPVATAPAVPPTDRLNLRFGGAITPPAMVHLGPYVAHAMGFFDEVGLDVEMLSFDGGIGAMRASKYAVDVVAAGGESLFGAVQSGQHFKAIGTYAPLLSVVMMSTPDIKSAAQLKGVKIGISESGGFNQVMALLVLDQAGISPDDVQWVNVTSSDRLTAVIDRRIDASVLHIEQYYAATRTAPDLNVLARLWDVAPNWWYSAFVAPTDVIDAKHEELVRFMTAVIKAQRFMYTHPVETKRIAVEVTKRQPEEVARGYEELVRGGIWSVNDGMPQAAIEDTIRRQIALGVLTQANPPTYDQVIERSIVEEAIARNGGRWSGDPRWK
jgi:ABC-type nitrate/sulfonate/bicarbonate transport system substrate-binding protein